MTVYVLPRSILVKRLMMPNFFSITLRRFLVLSFLLIVFLLIFSIFQINELTRAGFLVAVYEQKLTNYSQESKDLEVNYSQINSLVNLETLLKNLNYVKVDKADYLQILESTVAAK